MALTALKLPRLPANAAIVNSDGTSTMAFTLWWAKAADTIETAYNSLPEVQQAIANANAAAQAANTAAGNAQTAANNAQMTADDTLQQQSLINSYITPDTVLSATTTTITIIAHTRKYADGTSVSINGGTVAATGPGDTDYVYYNAPIGTSGTVTYIASTAVPTQVGTTHVVGAVNIPTTGTASGGKGPQRPGTVQP